MNKEDSIKWLQRRTEEYRSGKNDMREAIEDFGDMDKLGHGFSSADPLQKIDIGDGSVPRPTFINANMEADQKSKVCALLWEFIDCFAWNYTKMEKWPITNE